MTPFGSSETSGISRSTRPSQKTTRLKSDSSAASTSTSLFGPPRICLGRTARLIILTLATHGPSRSAVGSTLPKSKRRSPSRARAHVSQRRHRVWRRSMGVHSRHGQNTRQFHTVLRQLRPLKKVTKKNAYPLPDQKERTASTPRQLRFKFKLGAWAGY